MHEEVDRLRVGQRPTVSCLLKGVFNLRPLAPRYTDTSKVDLVLDYLNSLPDNKLLNLQQLSHKLAMLMALANADRCSDLTALDLTYRTFVGDVVRFTIPGLTKMRRGGPPLQATYIVLRENPQICAVQTLEPYEEATRSLRPRQSMKNPLFISVRRPHKPVKPAMLGKWLGCIMQQAGIDTESFRPPSTMAATSKAKRVGMSLENINIHLHTVDR